MAMMWFCHGCLKDFEGECPMDSKCEECRKAQLIAARKLALNELSAYDQELGL